MEENFLVSHTVAGL